MATDIFKFWDIPVKPGPHPADREVLKRVEHHFDLGCLPRPFTGPLRTAPVVLLFLSHRLSEQDYTDAKTRSGRDRHRRTWGGEEPLWGREEHESAWKWWTKYTKCFGDWEDFQTKLAILNLSAYHCKPPFRDRRLLEELPSSRVTVDWARRVLFQKAEAGKRVVVCMMSAQFWGLREGERRGRALFAPPVVRGHMRHGPMREAVIREVRSLSAR